LNDVLANKMGHKMCKIWRRTEI